MLLPGRIAAALMKMLPKCSGAGLFQNDRFFLADSGISYKNDSIKEYFVKLFSHMKQHQDICLALGSAGLMHIVKDQFDRVFLEIHRNEYDEYKSCFLAGGIYNIFHLWLTKGCKESPDELAERLESILER